MRERRPILDHIDLTVDKGDFIAITGSNGSGKTTLLRIILGLLKPQGGSIAFFDADGNETSRKPKFGYLPQKNAVDAHFPITVQEVVRSGLPRTNITDNSTARLKVEHTLQTVQLDELAKRPIGRLSGGQLQRALLARAIVSNPEVLVLDEPLSYIDSSFEEQLYRILQAESRRATILLVSHQMSRIAAMANRHIKVDSHTLEECTAHIHYKPEE